MFIFKYNLAAKFLSPLSRYFPLSLFLTSPLLLLIQNQFFISSLEAENVTNGIAEALRQRIVRAYKEGKKFRVIVIMPLLPSMNGEM